MFLAIIGLTMMFDLSAQKKVLTMEEAVIGYHLYPRSKYFQWQGDKNQLTYLDREGLMSESVDKGEKKVLLTVAELNKILGTELKGYPNIEWLDANTLVISRQGSIYHIDVDKKQLKQTFTFPKGAANETYSKAANAYAYTIDNNLYYQDERGNSYTVTTDQDKNIVNGQVVSRNEFGIKGGIFWSPDGKKLGFYRKDESQVTNFPLLDINTRTGELKEIKYPMAGMKSELVSFGVYDIASGKTTFLDVNDFGREQYMPGVTWSPESDLVYIQVLNRGQDHMRLNSYDASTGKRVATLFEEKSKTYVEPQSALVFMPNNSKQFIYSTNNRDGYMNLYLHDVTGKLIKRLTDVDADVEFVAVDRAGKYVYYLSSEVSPVDLCPGVARHPPPRCLRPLFGRIVPAHLPRTVPPHPLGSHRDELESGQPHLDPRPSAIRRVLFRRRRVPGRDFRTGRPHRAEARERRARERTGGFRRHRPPGPFRQPHSPHYLPEIPLIFFGRL